MDHIALVCAYSVALRLVNYSTFAVNRFVYRACISTGDGSCKPPLQSGLLLKWRVIDMSFFAARWACANHFTSSDPADCDLDVCVFESLHDQSADVVPVQPVNSAADQRHGDLFDPTGINLPSQIT